LHANKPRGDMEEPGSPDDPNADRKQRAYSSRLSRARAANSERHRLTSPAAVTLASARAAVEQESPGGFFSGSSQTTAETMGRELAVSAAPSTPQPAAKQPKPPVPVAEGQPTPLVQPEEEGSSAVFWHWNSQHKLMAVIEHSQLLKVIDEHGKTTYRVQLPKEGRCIFLGWEPSGAALAAVQDHGGAFLWFPSKPDCVQQWEGMQFSSRTAKKNAHFHTCFAEWSETRKLVLGLADGNFACWDLASNETFISRKHFAGKHRGAITCGAWGLDGEILALGSKNQIKISEPLLNASWEGTAAKLELHDNDLALQELGFSPSGQTLSAIAGTSIFRHLCLYGVKTVDDGKKLTSTVAALGEMHPNATIGGIQDLVWLDNEMVAVVTTNGYIRFLQYAVGEGTLLEDEHKPCEGGVVSACLCKSTGHVAIATGKLITFFDPLMLKIAQTMTIPEAPDGVRYQKLQSSGTADLLLLGRSDGYIFRVPVPSMAKCDLTLLTIRRRVDDGTTVSVGVTRSAAANMLRASCGAPKLLLSVSAAEGASCGFGTKLFHAWSAQRSLLAAVNDRREILVVQRSPDGSTKTIMKEQLPEQTVSLSWDPTSQSVLAIAIQAYGIALWDTKTDNGVQMWSGMSYKNSFMPLRKSMKTFDPAVAKWNPAGQLAVGMQDGSFAVWDSMSMEIATSGSSGKHRNSITAGDWYSSMFAPALALASRSTIKVSQGFDGVEWSATSMKVKFTKEPRMSLASPMSALASARGRSKSTAASDLDGYHFEGLKFSPNGKYLAALAQPAADPEIRQLLVYELQDERKSLVPTREATFSAGEMPLSFYWLVDNTVVVFVRQANGSTMIKTCPPAAEMPSTVWPQSGSLPGTLIDAATTAQGLVALALSTEDSKGKMVILTCPSMTTAAEMPLEGVPQSVALTTPKGHSSAYLSIGFEGGGIEVWELPPDAGAVDVS